MIENELKYVLGGHAALEDLLACSGCPRKELTSGYLNEETRIRREVSAGLDERIFTFKRRLPDGRNIEVARDLDAEAFSLLWSVTRERLTKRRYTLLDGSVTWDTDFFYNPCGEVYFAMAEAEMPPAMDRPERIHPVIAPHVAFSAARGDPRFSSRLIAGEGYARNLALVLQVVA